jgi:DNA-binding transcriptional LysR family regulator
MNLQYVRYALEIARTGSISRAADNLSVAQPNLSRAVKELEGQLGIAIFDRTRKGMVLTPEGERLLTAGERVLRDVDALEAMCTEGKAGRVLLSVIAPPSALAAEAFLAVCGELSPTLSFDADLCDSDTADTVNRVADGTYHLGLLRYPARFDGYYKSLLEGRGLSVEPLGEFTPVVLVGKSANVTPLTATCMSALVRMTAISLPADLSPDVLSVDVSAYSHAPVRQIKVQDRATAYRILGTLSDAYLWSEPMPADALARHGLLSLECTDRTDAWRYALIHTEGSRLTPPEERLAALLRSTVARMKRG